MDPQVAEKPDDRFAADAWVPLSRGVAAGTVSRRTVFGEGGGRRVEGPRRFGARGLVRVFAATALLLTAGCQEKFRDKKHPRFLTSQDAAYYVAQALEDPRPDQRRRAINRLGQTRYVTDAAVQKAIALVAKTDQSQSVRTAAVSALSKSTADTACASLVEILRSNTDQTGVAPPSAAVRAAAVKGLLGFAKAGGCPAELENEMVDTGVRLLRSDRSRNVRLAVAQLLGYFPRPEVLHELVAALEQRDFGVCHEAERSLMRLTGRTFDHDPRAWRDFLDDSEDPCAERGKLDHRLDPPRRKWFSSLSVS